MPAKCGEVTVRVCLLCSDVAVDLSPLIVARRLSRRMYLYVSISVHLHEHRDRGTEQNRPYHHPPFQPVTQFILQLQNANI